MTPESQYLFCACACVSVCVGTGYVGGWMAGGLFLQEIVLRFVFVKDVLSYSEGSRKNQMLKERKEKKTIFLQRVFHFFSYNFVGSPTQTSLSFMVPR